MTHFSQNDFFHIVKIRTDLTAANLLSESKLSVAIEGTDAEQLNMPFFLDTPVVAKVKETSTLHLTFQAEQEVLRRHLK